MQLERQNQRRPNNMKKEHKEYILNNYIHLVNCGWTLEKIKKEFMGPDGFNITEEEFSEIIKNRG